MADQRKDWQTTTEHQMELNKKQNKTEVLQK